MDADKHYKFISPQIDKISAYQSNTLKVKIWKKKKPMYV